MHTDTISSLSTNCSVFQPTMSCLRNTTMLLVMVALTLSACIRLHSTPCTEGCEPLGQVTVQDPEGGGQVFDPDLEAVPGCPAIADLEHIKQNTGVWCWASSTQSVMNRLYKLGGQPRLEQWQIANKVFEDALIQARLDTGLVDIDCSKAVDGYVAPPGEDPDIKFHSERVCKYGVFPEEVLALYDFTHDPVRFYPPDGEGVEWPQLVGEICAGRPIVGVVRWQYNWTPDGRHTGVVRGYRELQDGSLWVEYHDAGADGFQVLLFEKWYDGVPNEFSHEVDYLNIFQN